MFLKTKIKKVLILMLFCTSCTSNLDFDQADDLTLKPVVVANMAYFDLPANKFLDNGSKNTLAFDNQYFDIFRTSFFDKNLKKVNLDFVITNTISRAFQIDLVLFDKNNQPLDQIHFEVPAYSEVNKEVIQTEIFENEKLDILLNTFKIGFAITINPGEPLTPSSLGSLKLQSKGTVYLVIE